MAWNVIAETSNWEYSTTPDVDGGYTGSHTSGVRTNSDGTEIYVYCRQVTGVGILRDPGAGFGEINKTALEG